MFTTVRLRGINLTRKAVKEREVLKNKSGTIMAASALILGGTLNAIAAPIQVTVDGTPIAFSGTPPMEKNGSVLVPLRGVFEALRATVNYNAANRTISAQKGTTSVALLLDSVTATVNGQPQSLSQPAQAVGGTTLVPLRFVAQALGAAVNWNAAASTVEIKTQDTHLASLPSPAPNTTGELREVRGQLTGVYASTAPPQMTLRVNGQNTAIPYSAQTTFLRSVKGQPAVQVTSAQLKPGDQVTVQRLANGAATLVTATFGEVRGTIKSIGKRGGTSVITLNDGASIDLVPNAPITMSGREVALSDIMPSESVVIRTSPDNSTGYSVAVATGDNPNPAPPEAPMPAGTSVVTVNSFTDDVSRPLRSGDVIHATLEGTPGGKASFAIPGVVESVSMPEVSSGRYEGAYTVPGKVSVRGAAVLGSVKVGGLVSQLVQASGTVTIDNAAPIVRNFSPSKNENVDSRHVSINGNLTDEDGTGVDPASVRIRVDGQNVTDKSTVTPYLFSYTPGSLAVGSHMVQVTAADKAGNSSTTDWNFSVVDSREVQSFTSNAPADRAVAVGETVRFTLHAQPGGQATVGLGKVAPNLPLRETTPGTYVGEYTVVPGDNLTNAPVSAKFTQGGKTISTTLAQALSIDAGAPAQPTITSPQDDTLVGQDLTVQGKAPAGATVRVSIDFVSKALGGLFSVNGSAGSKDVIADKNGDWKAEGLSVKTNSLFTNDQRTVFTISAVTVDAGGNQSAAAKVTVRRG